MASQTEQLERQAEDTRLRLLATLEELRGRVTPGAVIDQVIDYARRGPPGEFFRNLGREAQENPMPLVLIGIGIAWLAVSTSRSSRALMASAADSISRRATEIGAATRGVVGRTGEAAARVADRIGDAAGALAERAEDSPPWRRRYSAERNGHWRAPRKAVTCPRRRPPTSGNRRLSATRTSSKCAEGSNEVFMDKFDHRRDAQTLDRAAEVSRRAEPDATGLRDQTPREDVRGRFATTPSAIPPRGWKDILLRVSEGISEDRILVHAAGRSLLRTSRVVPGDCGGGLDLWPVRRPRQHRKAARRRQRHPAGGRHRCHPRPIDPSDLAPERELGGRLPRRSRRPSRFGAPTAASRRCSTPSTSSIQKRKNAALSNLTRSAFSSRWGSSASSSSCWPA
jgi:hypothetical protein